MITKLKEALGFDTVSKDAYAFVKKGANKKMIWKKFASNCIKEEEPSTYFMAGAPGSGKTEIVKSRLTDVLKNCVVADADEIRKIIPGYNGYNSYKVQKAAVKGVDILYDKALKHGYSILMDGTFALNYKKCEENISNSIKKGRRIAIFYLYTHPRIAWTLAKKREYTEGRKIKIHTFINAFFRSRENINKVKEQFGDSVYVIGLRSNYGIHMGIGKVKANIKSVDEIQKINYTYISLLARVIYANILLQQDRFIWKIKKLLKK